MGVRRPPSTTSKHLITAAVQLASGRDFRPAFAAAVREDRAASASTHAQAETVLLGTTTVIRLESTFSHKNSLGLACGQHSNECGQQDNVTRLRFGGQTHLCTPENISSQADTPVHHPKIVSGIVRLSTGLIISGTVNISKRSSSSDSTSAENLLWITNVERLN